MDQEGITKKFYTFIQPAASVTLNDPSKMGAAEMIQMMHEYFVGQPRAMERGYRQRYRSVIRPWKKNSKAGRAVRRRSGSWPRNPDDKIVSEKGKMGADWWS